MTASTDPLAPLRSRRYLGLLLLAALLGVPVAAVADWFLKLVTGIDKFVYSDLPHRLGFHHEPIWWPVPALVLAGLAVGLVIRDLPGRGVSLWFCQGPWSGWAVAVALARSCSTA